MKEGEGRRRGMMVDGWMDDSILSSFILQCTLRSAVFSSKRVGLHDRYSDSSTQASQKLNNRNKCLLACWAEKNERWQFEVKNLLI